MSAPKHKKRCGFKFPPVNKTINPWIYKFNRRLDEWLEWRSGLTQEPEWRKAQ
jgi:hypothetical protein